MIYIRNLIESGIVSIGHLLGPNGYLSNEDFKAKYPDAIVNFMLYEGIVCSVRLGLKFEENCNINEAYVWKCMPGCDAKHIYMQFVKNDDVPLKCVLCVWILLKLHFPVIRLHRSCVLPSYGF